MVHNLKVRDVMSRNVFALSAASSAEGAAWALQKRALHAAPVCDDVGRPIGMVTREDLAIPGDDQDPDAPRTVGEAMTPAVVAIGPDAPALDACGLMLTHDIDQVVVVDASGALVGMVSARDCVHAVDERDAEALARERAASASPRPRRRTPVPAGLPALRSPARAVGSRGQHTHQS